MSKETQAHSQNTQVISLTIYKGHWNRDLRDKENVMYLFLLRTSILNDGKDELSLGAPAELKRIKIEYVQTIVCSRKKHKIVKVLFSVCSSLHFSKHFVCYSHTCSIF